ncbi:sensory box histidine kinase [Kordia algicida OT-1]|uniref:histidine kinase n=2 Tax=Kordia TaxID=221065 RepID=A9E0N0_9FLAO|nr:sensory box histidine kinase [Kordia algicida OT-1]
MFGFVQFNEVQISDFQNVTIDSDTEIVLDKDWEFYWDELITPGNFDNKTFKLVSLDNWTKLQLTDSEKLPSFGYATYRLKFSITEDRPNTSLYIPAAYAASKLWINGKLVSEIGHVGTTKETTLHRRFSQLVTLDDHETAFEIVLQVANFYHHKGGITEPLLIASSTYLQKKKSKRIVADMIFISSLSFIGIFFLLFFLFYWNKDRAVLYFGSLCVSLAYMALSDRYAPFAELFESASWIVLTKIEYISLFLAGLTASLFFNTIFSNHTHKVYAKIMTYGFGMLALLAIFLPRPHFTRLLTPFFGLMILNLIYVFYVIIRAIIIGERQKSFLLLVSMLLGSFVFAAHIFFFLGENINAIVYVNSGYVVTFLLLSMLLMMRFSNSFKELEKTKEFALAQKKEISLKSQELSKMNLELKEHLRQLEKSNAELDSFNHIVSHDLKAPLIAINTIVSFIEEDIDEAQLQNEETTQNFKLLKDRVSKMYALINDLLEYSKITKGKKSKESFFLNDLLNEIVAIINTENKHIINLPEKNIEIYTNKIELKHVFQNLVQNAVKHNNKEKAIITISFSKKTNEYVFAVSDNGPGIEPKYHSKIFEMFSQLNVNNEIESTGIGLSIVKKIVSENHGTIAVSSEKNKGATIEFSWRT